MAVAGANGKLGLLICERLLALSANVNAIVRTGKTSKELLALGQKYPKRLNVVELDYSSYKDVVAAFKGVYTVVSCLLGLEDVIIGTQLEMLKAAIECKVRRFIPSDFSIDIRNLPPGSNRNLENRRIFHFAAGQLIKHSSNPNTNIQVTSIFQGAFTDNLVLFGALDCKNKTINYFGSPTVKMEYTTWTDTAQYTAFAALDPNETPDALCIAGDKVNFLEITDVAKRITGAPFKAKQILPLWVLSRLVIPALKLIVPGKPGEVYPMWQGLQYVQNQASGLCIMQTLDNGRYKMEWENIAPTILQAYKDHQKLQAKQLALAAGGKSHLNLAIVVLGIFLAVIIKQVFF